ncbi:prepilin-type N-terminal cleavage/methylation domain-containing protein [Patescibacteria group bacterium]|nr:prepilin-type N-terminal cleavage/methylation domain-containing protein [Patescibacteria group bacterium]MBU2259793.1 prepilin-type N-terminal cleavage/methylation domain-containing protein [Patescibacteria group bacterium]
MRKAFSLLELLLVLAVIVVIAAVAIPMYRDYLIRNDLDLAEQQTIQMLNSAQARSRAGLENSSWGVSIAENTIYKGLNYTNRDPAYDEVHSFSPNITISGLTETTFSRLYGIPDRKGTIVLTAINGDTREITVSDDGLLTGPSTIDLSGDARMKIVFEDIKNQGGGSATPTVHVGPEGTLYQDGEWIPLKSGGTQYTDQGLIIGALGLAAERRQNFVRVLAHGGLDPGGKEVVDARIVFENAIIDRVENDEGSDHVTENPFDGNVSNGVGGDEVTLSPDKRSVLFQTRVTNYGDSILIYWQQAPPRWLR